MTLCARECYHNDMYNSEYCDVSYDKALNVVFVKWKKYCHHESYRAPLRYALDVIREHGADYVADTREGFEDHPDDTLWVKDVFVPAAVGYGCKTIYFIIDEKNSLRDELEGQKKDSEGKINFKYIYGMSEINER